MTVEVRLPDVPTGRSCRSCRKWDGVKCADMRKKHNDDPGRPCTLYRYREQEAVSTEGRVDAFHKRCSVCGHVKHLDEFKSNGTEKKSCEECRAKQRSYDAWRRLRREQR